MSYRPLNDFIYTIPILTVLDGSNRVQVTTVIASRGASIVVQSTGILRFQPNKLYRLTGAIGGTLAAGTGIFQFNDETAVSFFGQTIRVSNPQVANNNSNGALVETIFAPTVLSDVSFRRLSGTQVPNQPTQTYFAAEVI